MNDTGISDGNHALLVGQILGSLIAKGFDVEPVILGGDYTNALVVERPSGKYRVLVLPIEMS